MRDRNAQDPLRGVPLEALRGFEAAARHLNFTRAAEELNVTQSAVSREVRTLEERLKVALFDRTSGKLQLTATGAALRERIAESLASLREGLRDAAQSHARRPLTVLANRSFVSEWLMARAASDFVARFPHIELRFAMAARTGDTAAEPKAHAPSDIDVAIHHLRHSEIGAAHERLLTEYVLPACSPALASARARPIREIDDLREQTLIEFDDGLAKLDANWSVWFQAAKISPVEPARWLHVPDFTSVFRLAATGKGVCLGRMPMINDLLREQLLETPLPTVTESTRAYYLELSRTGQSNDDAQAFASWIREVSTNEEAFGRQYLASMRSAAGPPIGLGSRTE